MQAEPPADRFATFRNADESGHSFIRAARHVTKVSRMRRDIFPP